MQISSPYSFNIPSPPTINTLHSGDRASAVAERVGSVQPAIEPESSKAVSVLPQSTPGYSSRSKEEASDTRETNTDEKEITEREQQEIQILSARDTEVRNHERAHAAVGGQYAGAPEYQYQRGPDGINYAVSGEVSISTSKIAGDPLATIEKAQVIRRAALAPAEPSAQDRRVAALASQMEMEARVELKRQQQERAVEESQESGTAQESEETAEDTTSVAGPKEMPVFNFPTQSGIAPVDVSAAIDSTRRLLSSSYDVTPPSVGNIFSGYA